MRVIKSQAAAEFLRGDGSADGLMLNWWELLGGLGGVPILTSGGNPPLTTGHCKPKCAENLHVLPTSDSSKKKERCE